MHRTPDFSQADQVIQKALEQEVFPAACVLAGCREKVLFRRAYGRLSIEEDAGLCNEQTRFDLASVSKPLAVRCRIYFISTRSLVIALMSTSPARRERKSSGPVCAAKVMRKGSS